jgi:uncharacterized protein YjbI with pentapeptide repeats
MLIVAKVVCYTYAMIVRKPEIPQELLTVPDIRKLLQKDERLAELLLQDIEVPDLKAKSVVIAESRLVRCTFLQAKINRLQLQDCLIEHSDLSGSNLSEASLHTVAVTNTRCSGLQLSNSLLKNVRFSGCRLDLANFRFSKLEQVLFENCVITGLDLYNATLKNVAFVGCDIEDVEFSGATLHNVDLTESRIVSIKGLHGLKGARITSEQLVALIPYVAQEIGLIIE